MPRLTKFQRDCVDVLLARLDPTDPGFRGSDAVRLALGGEAHLYFDTWVRPLVQALKEGPAYHDHEHHVAQDAAFVRIARERAKEAA